MHRSIETRSAEIGAPFLKQVPPTVAADDVQEDKREARRLIGNSIERPTPRVLVSDKLVRTRANPDSRSDNGEKGGKSGASTTVGGTS
jgi:hypothetical protein